MTRPSRIFDAMTTALPVQNATRSLNHQNVSTLMNIR
jgi:hypothetical protein